MSPPRSSQDNGTGVPFVDLDRQHEPLRAEIRAAIEGVLERGDFILGAAVDSFEQNFAAYLGVEHAVGVASGTAALSIALKAAGIGPGDEVIVPAHTFSASAFAAVHAGAEPVFCDVDRGTGLIDPASAADAVGPRTAAVVAVHLYGQVAEVDSIREICDGRGLALIEDAAQAHGARRSGRRAGSLGDVSAFSFYPSKNLGAIGDGGMICTNDAALADRARRWRNLGQEGKGPHLVAAGNERLDTLQAAVLDVKLPHLDAWNAERRRAAAVYYELLPSTLGTLPARPGAEDVFHLFPVRVEGGAAERDALRAELTRAGIATGVHYYPAVHEQPAFDQAAGARRVGLVEAERWAAQELSLPIFAGITNREVGAVCAALDTALAQERTAPARG